MRIGVTEILIIVFAILLLFGSKKIPELFRSLGKSLNEFKRGQQESDPDKPPEKPDAAATSGKPDPAEPKK